MNKTRKAVERLSPTMAATDIMGDLISEIHPALHRLRDWPYPDQIDHTLYRAYMKQRRWRARCPGHLRREGGGAVGAQYIR
jgi:hypothetical protein